MHPATHDIGAHPDAVTFLINGSGFGLTALIAFLVFTAWLISNEVRA